MCKQNSDMVSIIVPYYNVANYIEKCVNSICTQNYKNIEIILINDGSTDDSEDICKRYAENDTRIKLISVPNGGVSKARNLGLKVASGKYVTFVDADDYIEPEYIEVLTQNMTAEIDLSICNFYKKYDEKIEVNKIEWKSGILNPKFILSHILEKKSCGGYVWGKQFDLEIIKQNQLYFDESFTICEDLVFVITYLTKMSGKVYYSSQTPYVYIQRDGSALHSRHINFLTLVTAREKCMDIIKINEPELTKIYQKSLLFETYHLKSKLILEKAEERLYKEIVDSVISENYKSVYEKCSLKEKIKLGVYSKHMKMVVLLRKLLKR